MMFLQRLLLCSKYLDRNLRKKQPDELWKISVLRGGIRFAFLNLWVGLYGALIYEHVPNLWVFRQLFYASIAAICVNSIFIEGFIMIGNHQIENSLAFLLKTDLDAEGNPKELTGWRPRIVYSYRSGLGACRNYGDFWYKEMDKFLGTCIFGILFILSLLPVAWLQTMLIWNDTFSDIMSRRTRSHDTTTDVLD